MGVEEGDEGGTEGSGEETDDKGKVFESLDYEHEQCKVGLGIL